MSPARALSHCLSNLGEARGAGKLEDGGKEPRELQTGLFSPGWHRSRSSRFTGFSHG